MAIFLFILLLVLLILVHELGHFSVAKWFGIKVHEFGVFFPPRLFAVKKGETEYSLNWLPFGGFVKIFGENYDEGQGDPRSFISKPRWQQALVIVAGVAFNILFAWLALSAGYVAGLPTPTEHAGFGYVQGAAPTIVAVYPDSPAQRAELAQGDRIVKVETYNESLDVRTLSTSRQAEAVTNFITSHSENSVIITAVRDGKEAVFLAKAEEGIIEGRKVVGMQLEDIGILRLPPHLALLQGAILGWDITKSTAQGVWTFLSRIVTGSADFSQIAGPIGITVFGAAAIEEGFGTIIMLAALISINLAIINLVPIPGLDGGRLLIIGIESVIRRPISKDFVAKLTVVGFFLLVALMITVSYHDIAKLLN